MSQENEIDSDYKDPEHKGEGDFSEKTASIKLPKIQSQAPSEPKNPSTKEVFEKLAPDEQARWKAVAKQLGLKNLLIHHNHESANTLEKSTGKLRIHASHLSNGRALAHLEKVAKGDIAKDPKKHLMELLKEAGIKKQNLQDKGIKRIQFTSYPLGTKTGQQVLHNIRDNVLLLNRTFASQMNKPGHKRNLDQLKIALGIK